MLKTVFATLMDAKKVRIVGISIVTIVLLSGLGWVNASQVSAQDAPDIIGGRESAPGAWPWQAAIVFSRYENAYVGQYCGGSLIAPDWVMTAAHCVDFDPPVSLDVVLGRNKLSVDEGERISVTRVIIHPGWSGSIRGSDVALLRLKEPSKQQPIPFDLTSNELVESRTLKVTVTGWGRTESGYPDTLRETSLPLVSHASCVKAYDIFSEIGGEYVSKEMVCAGFENGSKNVCYGDSGGPLMIPTAAAPGWLQVGIVSWGYGCAERGFPAVYTRVASYEPWIKACINDAASQICVGGDSFEPDDSAPKAAPLAFDTTSAMHTIHNLADTDWFTFDAKAGHIYQVDTVTNTERMGDLILWLHASDGVTTLAIGDNRFGDSGIEFLRWRAPADQKVLVQVDNRWSGRSFSYQLRVSDFASEIFLPVVRSDGTSFNSGEIAEVVIIGGTPVADPVDATPTPTPPVNSFPATRMP